MRVYINNLNIMPVLGSGSSGSCVVQFSIIGKLYITRLRTIQGGATVLKKYLALSVVLFIGAMCIMALLPARSMALLPARQVGSMDMVAIALLLSAVVLALVEYLKLPLLNTPHILNWMIRLGLVYVDDDNNPHIWFIPYITLALGIAMSLVFGIDLFAAMLTDATQAARTVLSAIVIGVGSNLIHRVSGK